MTNAFKNIFFLNGAQSLHEIHQLTYSLTFKLKLLELTLSEYAKFNMFADHHHNFSIVNKENKLQEPFSLVYNLIIDNSITNR